MTEENRMTALDPSVGADGGRSLSQKCEASIAKVDEESKSFEELRKLNVNAGRLLREYGIQYWNKRGHTGRQVGLKLIRRDDA